MILSLLLFPILIVGCASEHCFIEKTDVPKKEVKMFYEEIGIHKNVVMSGHGEKPGDECFISSEIVNTYDGKLLICR